MCNPRCFLVFGSLFAVRTIKEGYLYIKLLLHAYFYFKILSYLLYISILLNPSQSSALSKLLDQEGYCVWQSTTVFQVPSSPLIQIIMWTSWHATHSQGRIESKLKARQLDHSSLILATLGNSVDTAFAFMVQACHLSSSSSSDHHCQPPGKCPRLWTQFDLTNVER